MNHNPIKKIKISNRKISFVVYKTFKIVNQINLIFLSRLIIKSKHISELFIDLSHSCFVPEDINPLFHSLRYLNEITNLKLRYSGWKKRAALNSNNIKALSQSLTKLKTLKSFTLCIDGTHHKITNEGLEQLGIALGKLFITGITLSLSGKGIFSDNYGIEVICKHLCKNSCLKQLILEFGKWSIQLNNEIFDYINNTIESNPNLEDIGLYISEFHKTINNEQFKQFANIISNLKNLKKIKICLLKCSPDLSDIGLAYFANKLKNLKPCLELMELNLAPASKKQISNKSWVELCHNICCLSSLETLEIVLKSQVFNTICIGTLNKEIKKLNKLQNLSISFKNHELKQSNIVEFFGGIKGISKTLEKLFIELSVINDYCTDMIIEALSDCVKISDKLKSLEFVSPQQTNCMISDNGMKKLGEALKNKKHLSRFLLSIGEGSNKITDEGISYLCFGLGTLENLDTLSLGIFAGNNRISNKGFKELAKYLSKLKYISDLNLYFEADCSGITDIGLKVMGKMIGKLYSLINLELYFTNKKNGITYSGILAVMTGVTRGTWAENVKILISGDKIKHDAEYKESLKNLGRKSRGVKCKLNLTLP